MVTPHTTSGAVLRCAMHLALNEELGSWAESFPGHPKTQVSATAVRCSPACPHAPRSHGSPTIHRVTCAAHDYGAEFGVG